MLRARKAQLKLFTYALGFTAFPLFLLFLYRDNDPPYQTIIDDSFNRSMLHASTHSPLVVTATRTRFDQSTIDPISATLPAFRRYQGMPQLVLHSKITPKELCSSMHGALDIIIYIHSAIGNFDKRRIIRETWGHRPMMDKMRMRLFFVLATGTKLDVQKKVENEARGNNDILQGDFMDSYKNLTYKANLAVEFVAEHCPEAKFVLKTDDDVFVDIVHLVKHMHDPTRWEAEHSFFCLVWPKDRMPILRNPKNCMKWCVDNSSFPGLKRYPVTYCAGMAVIWTNDLTPLMNRAAKVIPPFWIDDLYLSGLLPAQVNVKVNYHGFEKMYSLKPAITRKRFEAGDHPVFALVNVNLFYEYWTKVLNHHFSDIVHS